MTECSVTVSRVGAASGVRYQRGNTASGIFTAYGVVQERLTTAGHVVGAGGVAIKRLVTAGGVVVADGYFQRCQGWRDRQRGGGTWDKGSRVLQ